MYNHYIWNKLYTIKIDRYINYWIIVKIQTTTEFTYSIGSLSTCNPLKYFAHCYGSLTYLFPHMQHTWQHCVYAHRKRNMRRFSGGAAARWRKLYITTSVVYCSATASLLACYVSVSTAQRRGRFKNIRIHIEQRRLLSMKWIQYAIFIFHNSYKIIGQ